MPSSHGFPGPLLRIHQETWDLSWWVRLVAITELPENAAVAVILRYVDDLEGGGVFPLTMLLCERWKFSKLARHSL